MTNDLQGRSNPALLLIAAGLAMLPNAASAQSTTTYTYDALGRLIGSSTSGGPTSGVQSAITYDPASNRSGYKVTGAPNGSGDNGGGAAVPAAIVIVVPLNGFTVIPIGH